MTGLRLAGASDLAAVARLEQEVFGSTAWSADEVAVELADAHSNRHSVVSTSGGTVIGYALLLYVDEVADLLRLAVSRDHRRQGRATALVGALIDFARARGCRLFLLEVAADNFAAVDFYAVQGFVEIDRRRSYYPGGTDALVLQKSL